MPQLMPLMVLRKRPEAAAALLVAAALAWWWSAQRMAGMDAAPGTDLGTLGWFSVTWLVMMAAMMLPSLAPTLAAYAAAERAGEPARSLAFAAGYLLMWTGVGIVAYALLAVGRDLVGGDLVWRSGGRWLSTAVLAAASVYELLPLKRVCLTRCRGQLTQSASRPTVAHALVIGLRSGGWCLGCSWALMAALFALGAMSLTWMAVIAVLIALEKIGPWPRATRVATAAVLAALAVGVVATPDDVPGLVLPSSGAMHAMKAMG
ncbi:MAG: DUF2182 domain-containing protein [Solirubrobacterales bacterium]|nr:DUF2182 domain-containing protein [Solirubrobacterales bacterium]